MAPHIDRARELIKQVRRDPTASVEAKELAELLGRIINH